MQSNDGTIEANDARTRIYPAMYRVLAVVLRFSRLVGRRICWRLFAICFRHIRNSSVLWNSTEWIGPVSVSSCVLYFVSDTRNGKQRVVFAVAKKEEVLALCTIRNPVSESNNIAREKNTSNVSSNRLFPFAPLFVSFSFVFFLTGRKLPRPWRLPSRDAA